MTQVSIESFARQIRVSVEKLLDQLAQAGISNKKHTDMLSDEEKLQLLEYLKGGVKKSPVREQISVRRKTKDEIMQTSRTGAARTVHVEVKKSRTFVKRSVIEAQQKAAREAELEAEKKRLEAEEAAQAQAEAERRRLEEEAQSRLDTERRQEKSETAETASSDEVADRGQPDAQSETAPPQPSPPVLEDSSQQRRKGGKKQKKDRWSDGDEEIGAKEELHAAKRRKSRMRRQIRKPGKISSSIAEQHVFEKPTAPVVHEVNIPETITVGDLAQAMSIKASEVIRTMMKLGSMVTINQILDQDTAILLVEEMGHIAKPAENEDLESRLLYEETDAEETSRPPVVTVMGHVDHGKTSLLDYLRKTKVVSGEAGGITQHIGAYKVIANGQEICFLDTPGHEAFSAMRARGARATDLIILVVAADDGVKPQTIEAINHAKSADVPLIVAINKIDREEANPDRVMQELIGHEVVPEKWGGDVLTNEVSALTGEGIEKLLESVLLQAELADLKSRTAGNATGLIIEARLDRGRGPVATVLVQRGTLKQGDIVLAGRETGRVRVINNDQGSRIRHAGPSTPVEIQGLAGVPVAGDDLIVVNDERIAREIANNRQGKKKEVKLAQQQKTKIDMFSRMGEDESGILNIVVKADVQGSVEALRECLVKLSVDAVSVNIIHGMVGGINESDVNLAIAVDAIIVGFNVRADASARKLIDRDGVRVFYHNVIYDVIDMVKSTMAGLLSPISKEQQVGLAEVRDVFQASRLGAVAGCHVSEGSVRRNLPVRVLRDNIVIFEGSIHSLRRFRDDVNEVKSGYECGIGIKDYNEIRVGDQIEVFEVVESAQVL